AVERGYVAAAVGGGAPREPSDGGGGDSGEPAALAAAAAGAVASRVLAVGTPRRIGLGGHPAPAALSLAAHRGRFRPAHVPVAGGDDAAITAAELGGRAVPVDEALAADIVCLHAPLDLAAGKLRRGTHVNALAAVTLDDELRALATIVDERAG